MNLSLVQPEKPDPVSRKFRDPPCDLGLEFNSLNARIMSVGLGILLTVDTVTRKKGGHLPLFY